MKVDKKEENPPVRVLGYALLRLIPIAYKADGRSFIFIVSFSIIGALAPITLGYIWKLFTDELILIQTSTVQVISFTLISLLALRYIGDQIDQFRAQYQHQYFDRLLRMRLENSLTFSFVQKISTLDSARFDTPETYNQIDKARRSYGWRIPQQLMNLIYMNETLISFIGAALASLIFGWWIPFVVIAAMIPRYFYRIRFSRIEWSVFNMNTPDAKELNYLSGLLGYWNSVQELRIFRATEEIQKRVRFLQEKILTSIERPLSKYVNREIFPSLLENTIVAGLLWWLLPSAVTGAVTLGSYIFYARILDQMTREGERFSNWISRIYENALYIPHYFDVLDFPKLIKESPTPHVFDRIEPPKIEFKNISFAYADGKKALEHITFSLEPGEHLAIVGHNGAGKSTLIKLLLRFYDPASGEILVNDYDLRELKISNWYQFIGTLFQDFTKYQLTVRDNIMLGKPDLIDEGRMIQAAKQAGAHEFIEKLPKKYDQQLGKQFDDSAELSHGQWQKLAIARAFYEQPLILILDEPTSAIDVQAEAEIFENLNTVYRGKSLIFVSHRFSTVRHAHKIIVLDNGQIIEMGSHEQLMKKRDGTYRRLFEQQAKGYLN